MKNLLRKLALLTVASSLVLSFAACSDDDNDQPKFTSDLIGTYHPNTFVEDDVKHGDFFINLTYKGDAPSIDLGFVFEGFEFPVPDAMSVVSQIAGQFYLGGLDYFQFKDDATIGAGYHEFLSFDLNDGVQFDPAVIDYPNDETLQVVPADAFTYYSKGGKVYFAVDKSFLKKVGESELQIDLIQQIDAFLKQYPNLGIVSSTKSYAIPLKYAIDGSLLTLKVDREMMLPYEPLIKDLISQYVPEELEFAMDETSEPMKIPAKALAGSLVESLLDKSDTFEIGIVLKK